MVIVMAPTANSEQLAIVEGRLRELGFGIHLSQGVERTIIGAIGDKTPEIMEQIEGLRGVENPLWFKWDQ